MFDSTWKYRSSICVLNLLMALLGISLSFPSYAGEDSEDIKQRAIEAFKQFNAMTEDQRNLAVNNMSETDMNMVMLGAAQVNTEVNETIEAMAPNSGSYQFMN